MLRGAVVLLSVAVWSAAGRLAPDAGGLYTYAGLGVGPSFGYGVAALGALAYTAMAVANYALLAQQLRQTRRQGGYELPELSHLDRLVPLRGLVLGDYRILRIAGPAYRR
ncbi:hypothetical protein SAMN05443668_103240 [Cryptosporangium aurantiacum]|uniref:Amino acid permease n=1 Tax=Cryptosporangium aurantiacum TaxID=134849 RepID=A0A1M7PDJ5_9ACTN|nr:hypothetical protein SAMN05443668_103240 [Cryptosporangium aurantiacum]